jgi:polyphosphate glucokinase
MLADRKRLPTPGPARPRAVAEVVGEIVKAFDWHGPVGCGFPAVIRNGVALTAANIHPRWIETNAETLFTETCGCPVRVINDADAAGLAEMAFGAGRNRLGTVLIVTIGTGLGTAIFSDGHLVPNVEMGHIEIHGQDAELGAADSARKREKLSWKKWAARFDEYLSTMEKLLWPDLIILGGGVIKKMDKFLPLLNVRAEIVPAQFLNNAGIVGAAMSARNLIPPEAGL